MLHDIWQAETRDDAHAAFDLFIETFEAKYPKATECLIKDRDALLTFYDFPAQHWQSIRTSNPIESVRGRCSNQWRMPLTRYHPSPDKAHERLSQPRWHAAHDVQAWTVCREKLAQAAWLRPPH